MTDSTEDTEMSDDALVILQAVETHIGHIMELARLTDAGVLETYIMTAKESLEQIESDPLRRIDWARLNAVKRRVEVAEHVLAIIQLSNQTENS